MNRTLPALTGLRFVAALAVFLFHFGAGLSERVHFPAGVTIFLRHGFMGVSVFFILSGFILSHSYQDRLGDWRDVVDFGLARFARIYPVYLVALAVALPLARHLSSASVASVLLMVQSWGSPRSDAGYAWVMQAWTLSVEVVFYLCFPILFAITRRINGTFAMAGIVATSAVILLFAIPTISPGTTGNRNLGDLLLGFPLPLLRMVEFFYGMLLCRVFLSAPRWHQSWVTSSFAVSVNLVVIVGLLAMPLNPQWLSLASVLFGLLIYQLAARRTWLSSLFSTRAALLLGGASYAIYLLQGPIREWVKIAVPDQSLGAGVNPVVLAVVSICVYLWIEEPVRRVIKRFARSLTRGRLHAPPLSRAAVDQ